MFYFTYTNILRYGTASVLWWGVLWMLFTSFFPNYSLVFFFIATIATKEKNTANALQSSFFLWQSSQITLPQLCHNCHNSKTQKRPYALQSHFFNFRLSGAHHDTKSGTPSRLACYAPVFACGTLFHASCHLLAVTVFHYMKSTNPPAFTAAALGHGYTITDARTGHRVGHVCTVLACWCKGTTAPRVTLYEGAHERGTNYVAALQQFIRSSVGS